MKTIDLGDRFSCFTADGFTEPFFFEEGSAVKQLENITAPGIILICGCSGTGKTHLLQLLAGDYKAKITTSTELGNEIFGSLIKGEYLKYIEDKARTGILLIDDFDSPNVRYIQKEFIRVINAVYQNGGLCIISSHYIENRIIDSFKSPIIVRLWREGHFVRFLCGCERAKRKGWAIPPEAIMKMSKKANSITALFGMMLRYVFAEEIGEIGR